MMYETETQVALTAVRLAAKLCESVRHNRSPQAIEKQDRSPVTVADFGAQAIICRAIEEAFPADAIVGEETSTLLKQPERSAALTQVTDQVQQLIPDATPDRVTAWIDRGSGQVGDRYWTLDPIDGTKGFLRGDQYAIALALIEHGTIKVGVMGCPALATDLTQPAAEGVLFVAVRGAGAQQIAIATGERRSLHVSDSTDPRLIESIEAGHGNLSQQRVVAQAAGLTATPIQMDSQAKYGIVARGEAALYLRLPRPQTPNYRENIWDHAAGAIVVEEAGGRVTDIHGQPLNFAAGAKMIHNRGVVASNGTLHERVLAVLQEQSEKW